MWGVGAAPSPQPPPARGGGDGGVIRLATIHRGFDAAFAALLGQARETTETVDQAVAAIIAAVRARGDAALLEYTARFDRLSLTADRLRISAEEIDAAVASVPARRLRR